MTKISDLHRRWSKDADYKAAYDALGDEFDLASALIEARTAAGLSQSQLAKRMKTSQGVRAIAHGS
jgi:ribosome-binding protein aMBF1 (putative translation factor)